MGIIDEIDFPTYLKNGLQIPKQRIPCPPAVRSDLARLLELRRAVAKREIGHEALKPQIREKEAAIAKALFILGDALYDAGSHFLLVAEFMGGKASGSADVLHRLLEKRPEFKADVLAARRAVAAEATGPGFPARLFIFDKKLFAEVQRIAP